MNANAGHRLAVIHNDGSMLILPAGSTMQDAVREASLVSSLEDAASPAQASWVEVTVRSPATTAPGVL